MTGMKINRGSGCSHSAAEQPAHEGTEGTLMKFPSATILCQLCVVQSKSEDDSARSAFRDHDPPIPVTVDTFKREDQTLAQLCKFCISRPQPPDPCDRAHFRNAEGKEERG